MQKVTIVVIFLLAIAYAKLQPERTNNRCKWTDQLKGWQRIFGILAIFLALLVILNPEFLAFGLVGDTAFFDLLVFAMSLQLHTLVVGGFRRLWSMLVKAARWSGIPSPGLCYLLATTSLAIGGMVAALQKILHRIQS